MRKKNWEKILWDQMIELHYTCSVMRTYYTFWSSTCVETFDEALILKAFLEDNSMIFNPKTGTLMTTIHGISVLKKWGIGVFLWCQTDKCVSKIVYTGKIVLN